jgi:hypothetical protein
MNSKGYELGDLGRLPSVGSSLQWYGRIETPATWASCSKGPGGEECTNKRWCGIKG